MLGQYKPLTPRLHYNNGPNALNDFLITQYIFCFRDMNIAVKIIKWVYSRIVLVISFKVKTIKCDITRFYLNKYNIIFII